MTAVSMRKALDVKGTDAVMTAAQDQATRNGYRVVIAVVDAWGHVLQLRRTDGAQAPSDRVAIDKARTAAIFVRPSREIEEQVSAGRLSVVADCFDKPNGLAFSPDERTLYVTDSGANQEPGSYHVQRAHHIVAFDVRDGVHLGPGRLFAVTTPGFPDGLKVDQAGRVYASSFSGVQVFSRAGDFIGQIRLPGAVNFTFGGPAGGVLFITADTAVWAAVLNTAAGVAPRHYQAPEGW